MVHMWFLFFSKSLDNIISINRSSLSYLKNFNIVIYIPTELESFFSLSWINSKHLYMSCIIQHALEHLMKLMALFVELIDI